MDRLYEECMKCTQCDLHKTRTKVVFGSGNENAKLVFIGEAPGADEDKLGQPFVGQAGKLLTNIIKSMGLDRAKDVYICNVLKCRPPGNRNPSDKEIEACSGYLERQLEVINPSIVVTWGTFASQAVLGSEEPISKLRGKWYEADGISIMCTYHPAYLLRNPAAKDITWQDMLMVMEKLKK